MKSCCRCLTDVPCASQIGIFQHLDRESQQKISDLAIHRTVQKGEILCSPEKPAGLYLISEGKVKVYELTVTGKEKLLRVLGKGDFVGEEALFGTTETYTFSEALTPLQVCHIPREDFLNLLLAYPSISIKLLEEFNRRLMHASHQAAEGTGSVIQRLGDYLLKLSAAQESSTITLPLPMKELAATLNTTPETLSRRMGALEKENIIHKKGKTITIQNPDALANGW